jgi:hypothetical protein
VKIFQFEHMIEKESAISRLRPDRTSYSEVPKRFSKINSSEVHFIRPRATVVGVSCFLYYKYFNTLHVPVQLAMSSCTTLKDLQSKLYAWRRPVGRNI